MRLVVILLILTQLPRPDGVAKKRTDLTGIEELGGPRSSDYGPDGKGYGGFPRPDYWPKMLSESKVLVGDIEGTVRIRLVIDSQGNPQNIRIDKGLGPGIDERAVEEVSKWRFAPARVRNLSVAAPINVEVRFRLAR